MANSPYRGRVLTWDAGQVRPAATLLTLAWKDLSRAERSALQSFRWEQKGWDAWVFGEGARLPSEMAKAYYELTPYQQHVVEKLGLTPADWDDNAQKLKAAQV